MIINHVKAQFVLDYFDGQPVFAKYGLTVMIVSAATLATLYIPVIGQRAAFLLFFFAIIQTAFWLGINHGIFAMVLSLVAVNVLILLPVRILTPHEVVILNFGFCVLSAVMIATTGLHRRLTKTLMDSQHDLNNAQSVGQIGSWRLNVQRNELQWSDENHRIFGIPKGTSMSYETFLATVHPDDREFVDLMWRACQRGEPYDIEHRLIVAGEVKWVREKALSEVDKNGNFLGGFGTTQDITEHKRSEAAIRETEARLALVMKEVHAGYWDWDLLSHTLFLSAEWKRQIGFDEQELPNHWEEWKCRLHPDDRDFVIAATENYTAGRQAEYELEFRLRHKDESYRWIHSRGGLLRDQNNRPYRMLGMNLDITDYKKSKLLDEQRSEMEESFRLSLATLTVAAIAHELNQPLTAISSYADVALKLLQTGNPDPQKLMRVLESSGQQAQRAGQVIRQLMSQLQRTGIIGEPVDINLSVKEALDFVKKDKDFGVFKIEIELAAGLPPVLANPLQIQKVLINLMLNGLESMREQTKGAGIVTVITRRNVSDPNLVQVTVCDSGKGVDDEATLKTMFQPFYTTKSAGLGMGLAISRAMIQSHGGNIWAQCNADIGLSIHFTLPFAK